VGKSMRNNVSSEPILSMPESTFSIDVIIPAYKSEYLRDTIQSVMQAGSPCTRRIYITDNCPDTSVRDICLEFPVIYHQSRHYYSDNFLHGISLGAGSLVHILCDDDLIQSNFYEVMFESFISHSATYRTKKFWSAASASLVINEYGVALYERILRNVEVLDDAFLRTCISRCINPVGELSGIMFERAWINHVGLQNIFSCIPGRCGVAVDFQLLANLAVSSHLNYIPEALFSWRQGHSNQSTRDSNSQLRNVAFWAFLFLLRSDEFEGRRIFDGMPKKFIDFHKTFVIEIKDILKEERV